eukprot:scaffold2384_cov150-Skeletonema_marinoi.AAC.2
MVTRTVILVTPCEAEAFAATSLSTPAAASADSINNAPAEQINLDEELQTNNLCNYPSYSKPAQDPSPGGLVQLCRHKECLHAVDFERRNGLCCVHQKGPMDGEQNDSSEDDGKIQLCSFRGCINGVTSDEGRCDTHATHGNKYGLGDEVGKKRALTSGDSISGKDDIKRQRVDAFELDLTGVPPQSPIPKSEGRIKEGASKYTGVTFNKKMNTWQAQIRIEEKVRLIGYYDNEEEAATDYARAVFKYKNQAALGKAREQDSFIIDLSDVPPQLPIPKSAGRIKEGASKYKGDSFIIDLSDVPPQSPISKSEWRIKEGASKYTGVSFDKRMNKWKAQIYIDGKNRLIGYYDNEEEAAVDYARAVFKYKNQAALGKARKDSFIIDLSDVPPQPPIPKSSGTIKEGASKYTGVHFNKQMNKWRVQIDIKGKLRTIGYYENEEEAATDYARAVFKYKGQAALDKARERRALDNAREQGSIIIDLSGVPPQPPITKSAGLIKEGASKYTGVTFHKRTKKWQAQISIEGKQRHIGCYENEEEAIVDYARAVFKYRGQFGTDSQSGRNN